MAGALETGALIGGSSLLTMIISKCRCFFKTTTEQPSCGCGFTDTPIQDDNEIHVKTTTVNGVELLYVGKKQAEDDDLHEETRRDGNYRYCPYAEYQ
jgi:hypothetical protein